MTDTGWSIILNAVVALGFAISLFYYDPFFYTRMMAMSFCPIGSRDLTAKGTNKERHVYRLFHHHPWHDGHRESI